MKESTGLMAMRTLFFLNAEREKVMMQDIPKDLMIRWHRYNGLEEFPVPYTRRIFLYETPVLRQDLSRYLDYEKTRELGVSLSLAIVPGSPIHYPELLAKRACWVVKHLCDRTDMTETGVPVRLGITHDMKEIVMPYLNLCQFPMDAVDWFDNREHEMRRMSKFDAMRHEGFASTQRVLHMDLNFLIGTHPTQTRTHIFSRLLDLWTGAPAVSTTPIIQPRREGFFTDVRRRIHEKYEQGVMEKLADFCGHSVEEEINYWNNADPVYLWRGGIFGFNRELIDSDEFWQDFEHLLQLTTGDEFSLGTYARAKGWTPGNPVVDIDIAFKWNDGKVAMPDVECAFVPCTEDSIDPEVWLSQHRQ